VGPTPVQSPRKKKTNEKRLTGSGGDGGGWGGGEGGGGGWVGVWWGFGGLGPLGGDRKTAGIYVVSARWTGLLPRDMG